MGSYRKENGKHYLLLEIYIYKHYCFLQYEQHTAGGGGNTGKTNEFLGRPIENCWCSGRFIKAVLDPVGMTGCI